MKLQRDAHQVRWLEIRNVGSSEIPPFGVVEITGASLEEPNRIVLTVQLPTEDNATFVAFNSWHPVPVAKRGLGTLDSPVFSRYYASGGTPAFGQIWGVENGLYELSPGYSGFFIYGAVDTSREICLVDRAPVSTYKPYIDFKLEGTLTTGLSEADATIIAQYGPGTDSTYTGTADIIVKNLETHTTSTYVFYADYLDRGRALHDKDNEYIIVAMECE